MGRWIEQKRNRKKLAGNRCEQCGDAKQLTLHRIVPGSRGGTYKHSNTMVLCLTCHRKLHMKPNHMG